MRNIQVAPRDSSTPLRFAQNDDLCMTGPELLHSLEKLFGTKIEEKIEFRGETTFVIAAGDLREVAQFCKEELSFDYLIDISSVDNFGNEPRFEIV